jgi:hypothetical protein
VTTQSLSMDSIFPEPLRPSRIPRMRISEKTPPLMIDSRGRPPKLGPSLWIQVLGWTIKNQSTEAAMTANLLTDIVARRVFNRLGLWSTHRPTIEEKHIEANVLTIPLRRREYHVIYRSEMIEVQERVERKGGWGYRIEAARRVSGYAAAVKIICKHQHGHNTRPDRSPF